MTRATSTAADRSSVRYSEVSPQTGQQGSFLAGTRATRASGALYLAQDWRPLERLRLVAGLRADVLADRASDTRTHRALSPRGGASLRLGGPGSPVSLFVQAARAFKAPTLDQLFDPRPFPDFQGGTFTLSNPELAPQRAVSFEAGVAHRGPAAEVELAAYRMRIVDEIDFDPVHFRYTNIGRSRHAGVELALRVHPAARVSPSLSYTLMQAEPIGGPYDGRQLKNVPRHLWKAALRARLPAALQVEARLSASRGRFMDDANEVPASGLTSLDLRVHRRQGRLRAHVDALNLLDRSQAEVGFVLPDLEGGVVPHVLPGHGRAVRAGLEWEFGGDREHH